MRCDVTCSSPILHHDWNRAAAQKTVNGPRPARSRASSIVPTPAHFRLRRFPPLPPPRRRYTFPHSLCLARASAAAAMASSSATREVLMLEAPPPSDPALAPWRSPPDAEAVDALPYIDGDYGDPAVKREVDRLVEEEMRRGQRKPADFLRDLPPVPTVGFEVQISKLLQFLLDVSSSQVARFHTFVLRRDGQ